MWFQPVERAEQTIFNFLILKMTDESGWSFNMTIKCFRNSIILHFLGIKSEIDQSYLLTRNRATTQTVIAGIDDQMDGIIEYSSVDVV